MTEPIEQQRLAPVIPMSAAIAEGILESRLVETALGIGHVLGRANIDGEPLIEAATVLEQARQDGRILSASEVLLHITASDSETITKESAARARDVLETIYPKIKEMAFSDLAIMRLYSELPDFAGDNIERFHHKTQASLETQLRRLEKTVNGMKDSQVASDEGVTPTAIGQGRRNLLRALGEKSELEELTEAAKARLIKLIASPSKEDTSIEDDQGEEPQSLEEVIVEIRDGKLRTSDPSDLIYTPIGPFKLPPNFDAEAITYLNTQKGNVHISDIVNTIFGRRLERHEFLQVRRRIEELCADGAAFNLGKGYFATYVYEDQIAARLPEPGIEFKLPDGFAESVLALADSQAYVHIGELVREIFGDRLEPDQFNVVRSTIDEMCASGQLINLGSGRFRRAGRRLKLRQILSSQSNMGTILHTFRAGHWTKC